MSFWSLLSRWLRGGTVRSRIATDRRNERSESLEAQPAAETPLHVEEPRHDPAARTALLAYEARSAGLGAQARAAESHARPAELEVPPALPRGRRMSQLDRDETMTVILEGPEEEILWSISRRIESRRMDLPTLPSTSMAVIDLANNPTVEFRELVSQISMDPVLSSELLRTANSVVYASEEAVDTLHAAVVRIGLRALRSMIFSVSMRGTILRSGVLSEYAENVWRQSYSVAMTAKAIAPAIGFDPEKAFLLGLLQDIGKIALLAMLTKEIKDPRACTPALVGRVFQVYHEEAGAAMAQKWRLPAEFVSVAGRHHAWAQNSEHTRSAALAELAHHLTLAFALDEPNLGSSLENLPSLHFLAPLEPTRQRVLDLARRAYAGHTARGEEHAEADSIAR